MNINTLRSNNNASARFDIANQNQSYRQRSNPKSFGTNNVSEYLRDKLYEYHEKTLKEGKA